MSTRSQRRFLRPTRDDATGVAQVYEHVDCYPSAVIHLLAELAGPLDETRTLRGPNYAAAQFLFLDTCSVMTLYLPADEVCEASRTVDVSTPRETV